MLIQNAYDGFCGKIYALDEKPKEAEITWLVRKAAEEGAPVCELACGTGRLTIPLAEHGFEVVGMDLSETLQWVEENSGMNSGMFEEYGFAPWTIRFKQNNCVIGWGGLCPDNEILYILSKDYWGQGYATELVSESLRYAFNELKLAMVEATVAPENKASIRVLEKSHLRRVSYDQNDNRFRYIMTQSEYFSMHNFRCT